MNFVSLCSLCKLPSSKEGLQYVFPLLAMQLPPFREGGGESLLTPLSLPG